MFKQKIINFIKTNGFFYDIYYYICSAFLRVIGIFIKTKKKTILFVSFGGKKYDDSPKALYEYICNDKRFDKYELIWAFNDPKKYTVGRAKKVKIDTLGFFVAALSSKYWITNSAIERGLNFKKETTFYINTWHGAPIKKIGIDAISTSSKTGLGSKDIYTQNLMTAQSIYDAKIFSRLFKTDMDNILICDLPRNDYLTNYDKTIIVEIKNKLGIDHNKHVILYAPTFREYERDEKNNCYLAPPINIDKWRKKLGDDYVILFRAHYEVAKVMEIDNAVFRNVSHYENLNELMIISDMLVSDYSSIFFDYAILERPILCFAYDLDEYSSKRGLYIDLNQELPCDVIDNEDTLIDQILNIDYEKEVNKVIGFKNKYINNTGKACEKIVEELIRRGI